MSKQIVLQQHYDIFKKIDELIQLLDLHFLTEENEFNICCSHKKAHSELRKNVEALKPAIAEHVNTYDRSFLKTTTNIKI